MLPAIGVVGTAHVVGLGAQILLIADDDTFALTPCEAVVVIVEGVLQSPSLDVGILEVRVALVTHGQRVFTQRVGSGGHDDDVKRMAR